MLNRREFVTASTTAAGGLLLAIRFPALAKSRPYETHTGASSEVSAWASGLRNWSSLPRPVCG